MFNIAKKLAKLKFKIITTVICVVIFIIMCFTIAYLVSIEGILDLFGIGGGSGNSATNVSTEGYSIFGCNLTEDEFIEAIKNSTHTFYNDLNEEDSNRTLYQVCVKNNINPCYVYAHACLESGYGSKTYGKYNYLAMDVPNGATSGKDYASYKEAIEDYCEYILNRATPSGSQYKTVYDRGQEYAKENSKLSGTPEENIYVLFSTYAYLGDLHYCNQWPSSYSKYNDILKYCEDNGSTSGQGGRYYTYVMYDCGLKYGLYDGRYNELCGSVHPNSSDSTTIMEKADYVVYTVNNRIRIAENIFGAGCVGGGNSTQGESGSLLSAASKIHSYMSDESHLYYYCMLGGEAEKDVHVNAGIKECKLSNSFSKSKNESHLVCCATYVSWCLQEAGYILDIEHSNSVAGLSDLLSSKSEWKYIKISNQSDLKSGDVCIYKKSHTNIYAGNGYYWDAGSNNSIQTKNNGGKITRSDLPAYVYRYTEN